MAAKRSFFQDPEVRLAMRVLWVGFWIVMTILAAMLVRDGIWRSFAWVAYCTMLSSTVVGCVVSLSEVSDSQKPVRRNERIQVSTRRRWLLMPVSWWPFLAFFSTFPVFMLVGGAWTRTMDEIGYYCNFEMIVATAGSPSASTLNFSTLQAKTNKNVQVVANLQASQSWPLALVRPWDTLTVAATDQASFMPLPRSTIIENIEPHFLGSTPVDSTHLPRRMKPLGKQLVVGDHRIVRWDAFWFDAVMIASMVWILAILGTLARMFLTTPAERRTLRIAAGLCPTCRYVGGHIGKCPECGNVAS